MLCRGATVACSFYLVDVFVVFLVQVVPKYILMVKDASDNSREGCTSLCAGGVSSHLSCKPRLYCRYLKFSFVFIFVARRNLCSKCQRAVLWQKDQYHSDWLGHHMVSPLRDRVLCHRRPLISNTSVPKCR